MPTTWPQWLQRTSMQYICAFLAGCLAPLALAPLNIWPFAVISLAALALLLKNKQGKALFMTAYCYGFGLFLVGVSWVYVSIHDFGNASVALAGFLTLIFAAGLALIFALSFLVLNIRVQGHSLTTKPWPIFVLAFSAIWVLGEWLRSWLLTGFPWLFIGYSQLQTPLAGLAPVTGIFGVSLAVALTSGALICLLVTTHNKHRLLAFAAVGSLWCVGWALQSIDWTQSKGDDISVALVQANIPQAQKWNPGFLQPTLDRYRSLSQQAWASDWVIWPEAAIPMLYHRALPVLEQANQTALQTDSALITGILYDDPLTGHYYNSITGLGLATGLYHKTRLVPFGEYVPLEQWLRGLIAFFNLPASFITAGHSEQAPLQVGSNHIASAICYEIVYPDLVANMSQSSDVILTISNDAWFGRSWGPLQHLEMAQMRALETGRYVIRGTNNGVSAIINPDGQLQTASEQFVQQVITGTVTATEGQTPFQRYGSLPIVLFCAALLAVLILSRKVQLQ